MTDNIFWLLDLKVNDVNAFKTLVKEMVASTKEESGTLQYEYWFNEDGSVCHLYERYADSAATLVHLGTFGAKFAERFMPLVEVNRFVIYGNPNADVKAGLAALNPAYMTDVDGFTR